MIDKDIRNMSLVVKFSNLEHICHQIKWKVFTVTVIYNENKTVHYIRLVIINDLGKDLINIGSTYQFGFNQSFLNIKKSKCWNRVISINI